MYHRSEIWKGLCVGPLDTYNLAMDLKAELLRSKPVKWECCNHYDSRLIKRLLDYDQSITQSSSFPYRGNNKWKY